MKQIIIAIDGHSSTGKSTLAKQIAHYLKYKYIDTGAMYRAVTLYALNNSFFEKDTLNEQKLIQNLTNIQMKLKYDDQKKENELVLNNNNIENKIRGLAVSSKVSYVAKVKEVRNKLVNIQREWGKDGGVVMDGRDIGTVVFPDAELKIFMTASAEIRAQRRYQELILKKEKVSYEEILHNVIERDQIDSTRAIAPLKPAKEAIIIDNSTLTKEEQFKKIIKIINNRLDRND